MARPPLTPEHKAALAAGRLRAQQDRARANVPTTAVDETAVDARNRRLSHVSGFRAGSKVTVTSPKHFGQSGKVVASASTEAEVQVELPGTPPLWFKLWELV